ncbi:hypothetical protein [Salinicola salarius]|uniref:hypothetical protein n=1 Tax=Salinicola salarius TaxID=430457 RepID=UPI000DA1773C|nr:hypothetical protein [Salinicola salarius]
MKHILHFQPFDISRQQIVLEGDGFALSRNDAWFCELVKQVIRSFQDSQWFTLTVRGLHLVIHSIDKFRFFRHVGPAVGSVEMCSWGAFSTYHGMRPAPFPNGATGGVQ